MKWVAVVRSVTGRARHHVGPVTRPDGGLTGKPPPSAARVEIEPDQTGTGNFFLIRFDENGEFAGDTWHRTLDEAKGQARFEFDLDDDDWTIME